jgi:hypothetical protein
VDHQGLLLVGESWWYAEISMCTVAERGGRDNVSVPLHRKVDETNGSRYNVKEIAELKERA